MRSYASIPDSIAETEEKINVLILMGSPRLRGNTAELCKHSNLTYLGMYSVQDEDDLASFRTEEAVNGAKAFARKVMGSWS